MGVPTSDGPPAEWADHVRRADDRTITLDPLTVELLCGGTCRWCRAKDDEITELRTKLHAHGVEGY